MDEIGDFKNHLVKICKATITNNKGARFDAYMKWGIKSQNLAKLQGKAQSFIKDGGTVTVEEIESESD
jgi:aspartate 1-decarboxylase